MNTRRNIKTMLVIFTAMFLVLCVYLVYTVNTYGSRWFISPYNTRLTARRSNVIQGNILDRNGTVLAGTDEKGNRVYIDSSTARQATAHVVGDNYGQTYGAENFFSRYLLGFDQSIIEKAAQALSGQKSYGYDVTLTIDTDLSKYIYSAMGDYSGAAVVVNYKTGEIYASVSKPTFDPKRMAEYLNGKRELDGSAMVNRVNSGRYVPGSVFKIVTAAAALRYIPNVTTRVFNCDGPLAFDVESGDYLEKIKLLGKDENTTAGISGDYLVLRDYNGDYHGEIDFITAFSKSCNHVFAQLAIEIGAERMLKTARDLKIGEEFLFEDMVTAASSYEKSKNDVDLAWSGIGQHTDLMTPLHMCMITASISNNGIMMEPKLLKSVSGKSNITIKVLNQNAFKRLFSKGESDILQQLMEACVEEGTGRNAKVKGYVVGGKTGTAEVSSNSIKPNAWFTGYVKSDEHPLAICIVLEKGGSGGSNAAPIAGKILQKAIELAL